MTHTEFMTLAGYEVSYTTYHDIIEPMYMATEVTKEEFVKMLNKKYFALRSEKQILKDMKACASRLKETCDHFIDWETKDKLDHLCEEMTERLGCHAYLTYDEQTLFKCYYPKKLVFYYNDYRTCKEFLIA